jgi:hypothetical protein
MFPQTCRAIFAIGSLLIATSSFAAEVELKASWTKGREHWLLHVQVARPGFFIAPNSPLFENDSLARVIDAATRQPIGFKLHRPHGRAVRAFDLAFPQLQRPINVVVSVGGLAVVDQKGNRVGYQQSVAVRAPASGDGHARIMPPPSPSPSYHTYSFKADSSPAPSVAASPEPIGGGATPPEDWVGTGLEVGEGAPPPEPEIPEFPFPPPQASAFDSVPRELLAAGKARPKLKDVDAVLSAAFAKCGYGEKSFYAVPDGFAMASRLEQINADGSFGANRWSLATAAMTSFSIESYLRALFQAREGHFRVVVFVVTNHPFQQTEAKVSSDEAKNWVKKGLSELPRKIGDRDFTDDYVCTALIYEFKTLGGGQAQFVEPSEITGHTHLEKSGLLSALARPR